MKKTIFAISGFFLISSGAAFAQSIDFSWPMLAGNARHTGLSPYTTGKDKKDLIWSYKTGGSVESSPVIGKDGIIYLGSHDGYLYALNPDGTLKWKFEVGKPVYDERWKVSKAIMATPAIDQDGTVYINGSSNYLHAIAQNGKEKWRFFIKWGNDFWNAPTVGNDGTVYIGTARNDGDPAHPSGLYAITPEGQEKWRYLEPSGVTVIPVVGDDGTIYFGAAETTTNKGRIIALEPNGKKKWQFDLEQWLEGSASIAKDGTIYSGSKEGYAYAINPDGTEKWRFKTKSGISATPSIGPEGRVYIGSWDGNFYALEPGTGKEIWRFDVKVGRDARLFEGYPGKEAICTTAAISADGVIFLADVFDTVYALDLQGKELWRYFNKSGGFVSSPAVAFDGTVYIGSEGGEILALSEPKANKNSKSIEAEAKTVSGQKTIPLAIYIAGGLIILTIIVAAYIFIRKK